MWNNPGVQIMNYTPDCTNAAPTPLSVGGVELNELSGARLHPNPSSGSITVENLNTAAAVSIYSVNGKKVMSLDNYTGESINVSALSSGLYLVSIETEESKEVRRLVKR